MEYKQSWCPTLSTCISNLQDEHNKDSKIRQPWQVINKPCSQCDPPVSRFVEAEGCLQMGEEDREEKDAAALPWWSHHWDDLSVMLALSPSIICFNQPTNLKTLWLTEASSNQREQRNGQSFHDPRSKMFAVSTILLLLLLHCLTQITKQ